MNSCVSLHASRAPLCDGRKTARMRTRTHTHRTAKFPAFSATKNINQLEILDKIDAIQHILWYFYKCFRCRWWLGAQRTQAKMINFYPAISGSDDDNVDVDDIHEMMHYANDEKEDSVRVFDMGDGSLPPMGKDCAPAKMYRGFPLHSLKMWKDEWNEPKRIPFVRRKK